MRVRGRKDLPLLPRAVGEGPWLGVGWWLFGQAIKRK